MLGLAAASALRFLSCGLPREAAHPSPSRVPTGAAASAPAWAGGFPRPGDLEGQRSTPQARGFRSRAASPSSPPLRPRPPSLVALGRPAPDPGRGRGGESTEGLTHVLRTRAPPGPPLALQQPEIAKSSLGKVGGEALGRRRGKQVKREGRGGVTAHKSPSPTLGPHSRGAPAPRGMEGHSATPGRPLSSPRASALP